MRPWNLRASKTHGKLPRLERWRKNSKPNDVVLRHYPVVRHDSWVPLAKTYFTLEAMGEVDRLHTAVFRSYHVEDLYMSQEKVISEWAAKNGLDHEKFMAIYRSDETRKKVERIDCRMHVAWLVPYT